MHSLLQGIKLTDLKRRGGQTGLGCKCACLQAHKSSALGFLALHCSPLSPEDGISGGNSG